MKFLNEEMVQMKFLRKLDAMTKESKLTKKDILEISGKINKAVAIRHGIKA